MAVPTAKRVKPVGPVEGSRRAYLMEGNPPGGGPSCTTGMSFMDCTSQEKVVHSANRAVFTAWPYTLLHKCI